MKVCFVAGCIYPLLSQREHEYKTIGGAEVQQLLVAQELLSSGVGVCFVSEDYGQGFYTEASGFCVYGYEFTANKIKQALSLWRAIHASKADIIVVRGVPNYLSVLMLYCLVHNRKLVLSISTNLAVFPREVSGLPLFAFIPFWLSLRWASTIVVQSLFQKINLEKNFGAKNLSLISSGALQSTQPYSNEIDKRVVWLASIHPRKGPEAILDLAAMLPDLTFQIGGGPWRNMNAYYQTIKDHAEKIRNVEWLGYVSHDGVDRLLSGALALVNTTIEAPGLENVEGFPNTYIEAWRNGVPTLTLHNDPDDVISKNGLGFHCSSLLQLAETLNSLSLDCSLRERIGQSALKYFIENHTITRAAIKYMQLFDEVLLKE